MRPRALAFPLVSALLALLAAVSPTTARAQTSTADRLIARVDGRPILLSDVRASVRASLSTLGAQPAWRSAELARSAFGDVLERRIDEELLASAAGGKPESVAHAEVQAAIGRIAEQNGTGPDELLGQVLSYSLTADEYRSEVARQIAEQRSLWRAATETADDDPPGDSTALAAWLAKARERLLTTARQEAAIERVVEPPRRAAPRLDPCRGSAQPVIPESAPLALGEPAWGVRIERVEIAGLARVPESLARGALASRAGEPLDAVRVRSDVLALLGLEAFADAGATVVREGDAAVLRFVVSERARIGRVVWRGIRSAPRGRWVPLAPGELYDAARVARSAWGLQLHYRRLGYGGARVEARQAPAAGGRVNVCFRVSRGARSVVESLDFAGNQAVPDAELAAALDTRDGRVNVPGRPYRDDLLRSDRSRLLALYYDRGHLAARIGRPRSSQPAHGKLRVELRVDEGPAIRLGALQWKGPRTASTSALSRALGIARGDVLGRTRLLEGIARVREVARAAVARRGKPRDVSVTPDLHVDEQRGTADLTLSVELR